MSGAEATNDAPAEEVPQMGMFEGNDVAEPKGVEDAPAAASSNAAPPANAPAAPPAASASAAQEAPGNSNNSPGNVANSPTRSPGAAASPNKPKLGGHDDLKARTMFTMSTTDGVLKRTTFMDKISRYPSAPQVTIATRGENMFERAAQGPAPGSYNLEGTELKSKFKGTPKFSFGASSRFGLGGSPSKQQPGPGAYNPKDPSVTEDTKVGFGTSIRAKPGGSQANPGPGAYECRSTVGGGVMFTARGRHVQTYMRSRSLPGPGAYSPTTNGAYQTSPKCGFGTSVRGDFTNGDRGKPGPGTYDMQNFKTVGKDTPKYSATSRRKMHDLNSYVTPGPGTYNAHVTSFGAPGATSCKHVDEAYAARSSPRQEAY